MKISEIASNFGFALKEYQTSKFFDVENENILNLAKECEIKTTQSPNGIVTGCFLNGEPIAAIIGDINNVNSKKVSVKNTPSLKQVMSAAKWDNI